MPIIRSLLILSNIAIFVLGLVMIFNTSSAEIMDMDLDKSMHAALLKQIISALLGLCTGYLVWKIGYREVLNLSMPFLVLFTILLFLCLIPGIGISANGSRRWVGFSGFTIQPSEFAKILIPIYFTHAIGQFKSKVLTLKEFLGILPLVVIPMLLVLVEPDNGTTAVIGMNVLILLFVTRVPFRYWAVPMLALVLIGGVFAYNSTYVSKRLNVYLNPEADILGKGHQPHQAKIAAGSGELFGRGPGRSIQKLSYLPEAQNDYIAAIYAEEFGFVGVMGLLFLYMIIGYCGFHIAFSVHDPSASTLAASLTLLFCLQAFLNLGVVSGLLPSTGLNLPMFSQGGTSLMANIGIIAIILNVSYSSSHQRVCV
jgi:cell division protein FtsW